MVEKIVEFFTFFAKLSPSKMINIVLLGVIFFVGWWSWDSQEAFKAERDDFKAKYDTLYVRYTAQVDKNQMTQNQLKDSCQVRFERYADRKDAEIKSLVAEFNLKYSTMLKEITDKYDNTKPKTN